MALAIDITDGRSLSNEHVLLLKRQSTSVLKVGVLCGLQSFKRRLAYSVTVSNFKMLRISLKSWSIKAM